MIDTHAHLDACADPPEDLVARARAAGVNRILTVGTSIDGSRAALELADRHAEVFAVVGVHPHNAGGPDAERLDELRELLEHPRAVAVGETGLDHYRDYAPRDAQRRLFELELELAASVGKPVVVHTRAADDETLAALSAYEGDVVLHCFSSPRLLAPALKRGWYISFAGNVTYKNASDLRLAATETPADRILTETDCPYLAPQATRGRPNEPAFVVHTFAALAAARRDDASELERRVDANAATLFRLR